MSGVLTAGPGVEARADTTDRTTEGRAAGDLGRRQLEAAATWQPLRIGPRFHWLDHDRIRIDEGRLAGCELGMSMQIRRNTAELAMLEGNARVGEVSIERDPPGRGIVLWDIGVREHRRGNGLAAVMTWCVFRELLQQQETATFRIRMVRSLKAGQNGTQVQNIGICVIAARLGFQPDVNLEEVLDRRNITGIELIPRQNGTPPGLRIMVKTVPLVLVAFVLEPRTMRPVDEDRTYFHFTNDEAAVLEWARQGRLIITNGNYSLRREQAERFADLLATDVQEARLFRSRVRGL